MAKWPIHCWMLVSALTLALHYPAQMSVAEDTRSGIQTVKISDLPNFKQPNLVRIVGFIKRFERVGKSSYIELESDNESMIVRAVLPTIIPYPKKGMPIEVIGRPAYEGKTILVREVVVHKATFVVDYTQ